MKIAKLFTAALLSSLCLVSQATVIDFSSETAGAKANGYTVNGVQFVDSFGGNLEVNNYGGQSNGHALAVFGDDSSFLRMLFPALTNSLSLNFGNDDAAYSGSGDIALLRVFLGGVQVGQSIVVMNRNDLMDQLIQVSGVQFNEATFVYANSSGNPINLIEIVDNINFNGAVAVPEPESIALLALGLLAFVAARKKSAT